MRIARSKKKPPTKKAFVKPRQAIANHSFVLGQAYLIRTVTYFYTGRLVAVTDADLVLEDAAWIADTGRFATALQTGVLNEVEPYPSSVIVGRGAIVDVCEWLHALPRDQK